MSRRRRRGRAPSLAFRIAASALIFLLAAGVAELAARSLALDAPTWRGEEPNSVIMVGHPTRLWGMGTGTRDNAGATAWMNEEGLRGPLPELPRPDGRERIIVLGDSTFFGHGVADDATLPARLEGELRAAGVDVDVVNAAVPGYSTEQSLLLMAETGWALQPTLLLIGNLWSDNNVDGFRDADLLRTAAFYRDHPLRHSAFYRLLAAGIDRVKGAESARLVTWTRDSTWPEAGTRRVPLDRYAANLDRLVHEAAEYGAGAAFIAPTNDGLVQERFRGTAGWDPYFDAQRQVADHHGQPVISALRALQADAKENGVEGLFIDEMHPSARGHRLLGKAAAAGLLEAGWPDKRLLGVEAPFDPGMLSDVGLEMGARNSPGRSPQAQLFASTATQVAAPGQGSPAQVAGGPWKLEGSVAGGRGALRLRILSRDGLLLQEHTVGPDGHFSYPMDGTHTDVDVVVNSEGGEEARGRATVDGGHLGLVLPQAGP